MIRLSIVIPVYNAEKTIEVLCKRLIELYSSIFTLEIVLVNDFSADNSDEVCKRLQSEYSEIVTYIRLSKNFGEHNAVMAGLNYAKGDYCVIMDDDMQNPPEEVAKLVDEIIKGYDVVYSRYESKRHNIFRNMGSRFNGWLANVLLKKPADLYLSSFKAINRFLMDEIVKYTGPDPYVDGIVLRTTRNIGTVTVRHSDRMLDKSGYTMGKLISLWGNTVVSFSLLPIRLMGIIGLVTLLYSIFYGIYMFIYGTYSFKLTEHETSMFVRLFYDSFLLMSVSLVGEYIGRGYLFLNREPQFIVREVHSSRISNDMDQLSIRTK